MASIGTHEKNLDGQSLNSVNADNNSHQDEKSLTENQKDADTVSVFNKAGALVGDIQPIAKEFRQRYEQKLQELCEGDNLGCIQAKMKLQEDWIRDLTEQNETLIKAVIELESEATERVKTLEGKLKDSDECVCEAQENIAGKERKIEQLQTNLALSANHRFEESDQFRQMQANYSILKQTMQDVRDALTAEVADKHDAIVKLRGDVQSLEEQCRRADQQTYFKHEIIKQLRKDIKHLTQEGRCTVDCPAHLRVVALERENKDLKGAIKQAQQELEQLEDKTENYLDGNGENYCRTLRELQQGVNPTVTICEVARLDDQILHDPDEVLNIFIGTKPRGGSSKKSSTYELEDVINNLSDSVSQMMMRNAASKSCNRRIQDLEYQLAETMKTKDMDIDEERNRRNVEINNLIRTIQEQDETLQSLQSQSKNLTECVNFYLNSVKILQESEDKHKAQVAQQKITIGNLQEALMKVKTQAEELQLQRSIGAPEIDILHSIISKQELQFLDFDTFCKQCFKEYSILSNNIVILRDENLALAAEYFNNFQDNFLFKQKNQKLTRDAQMNVSALQSTIKELQEDHNQMCQVIECQKAELRVCSQELFRLQDILQTESSVGDQDVEKRLQDALKTNQALVTEVKVLKSKVISESKSGAINQERISELQAILGDKNVEINRWHTTALDFKRQLEEAAQKQADLEHNINSMQRNMAKSDIVSVIQNEETDACREEVDVCLGELRELKGKINLEASIYSQKMEQLQALKNRCALQNGTIEGLRRDLTEERIRHKDEILNLKQQIRELKERDTMLDIDNRKHLECIKHLEDKLKELSDRELQLKNESSNRESELSERVTKSKSEEIRLVNEVTQLEQRAAELDAEVQRLRAELGTVTVVCADRQGEMASLKTEVNLLLQRQGKIKNENSKLRAHINNLQRIKRSTNGDSEKLMGQLDNVLRQLEHLHGEKEYLVIQNEQLQQCMCTREAELLQAQEQLEEIRANRDEVCEESRTVVSNVRQWLHHQHSISEQVKEKVKKLERENRDLQLSMQEMTSGAVFAVPCRMRGGSPVRSMSSNMIYPCNCNLNSRGGTQSPASVTSVGSGSSADDSSVNYSSGSENELEIKLSKQMSTPEVWLHKVENMTAELQRSNSYWKRKLYKTKTMQDEKQ